MPIISFNVSDNLKKFLKKMVQQKEYKNSSNVIRDALVRLMSEKDLSIGDLDAETSATLGLLLPTLSASVMITFPSPNPKIEKKLNRMELNFHSSIVQKSKLTGSKNITITYLLEDDMNTIQGLITELNSFEELKSFRYVIDDVEEN